jgi:hypothetical protein
MARPANPGAAGWGGSVRAGVLIILAAGLWAADSSVVKTPGLAVSIGRDGRLSGARLGSRGTVRAVSAETVIAGCDVEGAVERSTPEGGGVEFHKKLRCEGGRECRLTERFLPGQGSVRWEVEVLGGAGGPWSAPIETRFHYPVAGGVRFWTAWSDPRRVEKIEGWRDPLEPQAPADAQLWFGAPPFRYDAPGMSMIPFRGDLLSIPLFTFSEAAPDLGLSLVLSPADAMLDLGLHTTASGDAVFSRLRHRIAANAPVRFAMDLVAHEAGWRGGLRWMSERYPRWFNPVVEAAHDLAGTGAYSETERPFDVAKMKRMAFRTNWKASFDFPYMGMFLAPLPDDQAWPRFSLDPERRPAGMTSVSRMAAYSRHMRELGFYVLSYFNVTEFGARVRYPEPPRTAPESEWWKSADDYLYGRLKDAILYVPDRVGPGTLGGGKTHPGGPYYTWGDAIVTDCADPAYAGFLLEQARRHVEKIPDASGICIDRMDWLRMYNERADDGASWFEDRPARSLLNSWRELMGKLGPLMHSAGKVIFVNNHDKRIDLLDQVDGFFDEFTYSGAALNTTALQAIRKPALGWTAKADDLKPDADAFFQKYLYLGVYPMAPFPGNDHSLAPGEWVDRQYLDYGPLLEAMRGKKWVLAPHAVEVTGGSARANLFEVPGGYVIPLVFGGGNARVRVSGVGPQARGWRAESLFPGETEWRPVRVRTQRGAVAADVPLRRGCAMLRLRPGA